MKILKYLILSMIFLLLGNLNARFYESQILEYGGDIASLGSGGVSTGKTFTPGISVISPAASADVEIPVLSFNYGDIIGFNNFLQISYLYPTSRGILTGNIRYFGANILNQGLNNAAHINLNFSKVFTEKFFVGIGLNFLKAEYIEGNKIALGMNLGAIYHLYPYTIQRKDKLLKNLRIGASFLNIGNAFSQAGEVISPPFVFRAGPSLDLNLIKNVDTVFSCDFVLRKMKEFYIGVGIENIIKEKIRVRLGYQIESEFANLSFGAGYKFSVNKIQPEINYALISCENDKILHFLGANIYFGTPDTTPPETKISLNLKEFSPNYDGNADYLEVVPTVEDNKILKYWEIKIVDSKGNVVKEYKSPNIDTLKGKLTFKKILTRLFEKKKEAPVPDKIVWDGVDEKGRQVKDGKYRILVKAYDEKRNTSEAGPFEFIVDNTPPEITIKPESKIFSPNNDGVKDTIKFSFDLKAEDTDKWIAQIIDKEGNVIKTYNWQGTKIKEIIWDGRKDTGELAPDGNYDLVVKGKDNAGNFVEKTVKDITLTTARQSVSVSADLPAFSPNNDNIMDKVVFETYISDTKGLEKWKLSITDNKGNIIKTYEGDKDVPETVEWDGRDKNGNLVDDGTYFYKFEAWYDSGNHPESFPKQIIIDKTPPAIEFGLEPEVFSPDGDEEDDVMNFSFKIDDKSEIKKWELTIIEVSTQENVFKRFEGTGNPAKEILWNGLSDDGRLVSSKNKYFVSVFVEDELGNKKSIKRKEIKISTEPPDVDFEFEPQLFSPDGDGENDILKIKIFSYDNKKIKHWVLNIYPIRGGKRESVFKRFEGEELPGKEISWDGKNDKGELVESAMDYELELIAENVLGNIKKLSKILNVDVLVIKTPYGWRIKISNIEFEYNKADLRGNAFKILDRVIEILEKYPNYSVRIEGHTDNIGSLEYNLELSKRRAESVYKYLVENGIDANRLTTIGLAFKYPVASNDTEEGRAKNRRVEFILIKPGAKAPVRE